MGCREWWKRGRKYVVSFILRPNGLCWCQKENGNFFRFDTDMNTKRISTQPKSPVLLLDGQTICGCDKNLNMLWFYKIKRPNKVSTVTTAVVNPSGSTIF